VVHLYIYDIYIQLVRAAVNTEVEVFDFAAATAGVKTFSSECAGPVSEFPRAAAVGTAPAAITVESYTEESSGETNTMLHYAHACTQAQIYDIIGTMYLYICIYMCGMKYGAYAK